MQILKDWCYVFISELLTDGMCDGVLDALKAIGLSCWEFDQ